MVAVAQKESTCLWSKGQRGQYPSATPTYMKPNTVLKLAVQKKGRLTEETLSFLRASGLSFESTSRKLFSSCRNFPLDILYLRDDDIPNLVASGIADLGIVGQNIITENRPRVKKLLNLRFGFCSLGVSVPKDSPINTVRDLSGKIIATSYPESTKRYFEKIGIPVSVVVLCGSVEIAPTLGIADAIADLVSTGSTLRINDLRLIERIYPFEAVLIANEASYMGEQNARIEQLVKRFKAVLSAADYKYLSFFAPSNAVEKLAKILPNLALIPTGQKMAAMQAIIEENTFWDLLPRLKFLGVKNISMLPIEKYIS